MMMMNNNKKMKRLEAEDGIKCIGLGFDLTNDLKLKFCKADSNRLITIDDDNNLPGHVSTPNVPKSIKCDKGDRMRLGSDVLSFQQVYSYTQQINLLFFLGQRVFFFFNFSFWGVIKFVMLL